MEIHGQRISPREMTSRIMFPRWQLRDREEEFTIMRVTVEGRDEMKEELAVVYDLLDCTDQAHGISSMARTTGYAATAAVDLLARGLWRQPGIAPPEVVGREPACFQAVLAHLQERGVNYRETVRK